MKLNNIEKNNCKDIVLPYILNIVNKTNFMFEEYHCNEISNIYRQEIKRKIN